MSALFGDEAIRYAERNLTQLWCHSGGTLLPVTASEARRMDEWHRNRFVCTRPESNEDLVGEMNRKQLNVALKRCREVYVRCNWTADDATWVKTTVAAVKSRLPSAKHDDSTYFARLHRDDDSLWIG